MIRFHAASFMKMHRVLAGYYRNFVDHPDSPGIQWPLNGSIAAQDREEFRQLYDYHELVCKELGLAASLATLEKLARCLERSESTYEAYFTLGIELGDRLVDELSGREFVALNSKETEYYNSPQAGWKEALNRFPNLASDVDEASRCLALGRYTAAVFHLMRIMELTVQTLSKKLGTENLDRVWGHLLSDIGKAIEKMPAGPDRNRWSEAHSLLYHVKQAWRNDVMHPKQTYTEEEAKEVYSATRSFAKNLALLI